MDISRDISLDKSRLRSVLFAIFVFLSFRTFYHFPYMYVVQEVWIFFSALLILFPYGLWKLRSGMRFSGFELYILVMIVYVPLLSSLNSLIEFGQPLYFGLLTQRHMALAACSLALLFAIAIRMISYREIENAFLICAWSLLFLYSFMIIWLDPRDFINSGQRMVSGGGSQQEKFVFDTLLIVFGFYYYSLKALNEDRLRSTVLSLFFLCFLLIAGRRALILSLVLTYIIFAFKRLRIKQLIVLLPKISILVTTLFAVILAINENIIFRLIDSFLPAFSVVLTGQEGEDASANARILGAALAFPYILENWAFGNGDLSHQWLGGFEGVLGSYFYPSDIGIIGAVFMYGALGVLPFLFQISYARKFFRGRPSSLEYSNFADAVAGILVFLFIHSIFTGRIIFHFQVSVFMVTLLYGLYYLRIRKQL